MSYVSAFIPEAPAGGLLDRITAGLRDRLAERAERRRSVLVGLSLIRSGDREMGEVGKQILGGRPISEVFGDR